MKWVTSSFIHFMWELTLGKHGSEVGHIFHLGTHLRTCLEMSGRMCMTMESEVVDLGVSIQIGICFSDFHYIFTKNDPSFFGLILNCTYLYTT